MTDYRDHHATIFVAPAIAGPIEAVRVSAARHACPSADVGPRRWLPGRRVVRSRGSGVRGAGGSGHGVSF